VSPPTEQSRCDQAELVPLYALQTLPAGERSRLEMHLPNCPECQQALAALRPLIDTFIDWPTDILRSSESLWSRLVSSIGAESGDESVRPGAASWPEPEWANVAPGISCKLLSNDPERDRVSMLVRLAPGTAYPPHRHAGAEELFLLGGELWIEDRKLHPGDYNRAEAGTADQRVWSETGCTCLLITSPSDVIA
jgi:hypothetical protein